ncbi:MAG: DUF2085 domain-containing protein [Anaerolineae bacterium]|nr:DUF2085 domain-containing protein [Anaerolineae bacterium]
MSQVTEQPTTEQILAEVERRRANREQAALEAETSAVTSPTAQGVVRAADRLIFWLSKHWLAIANLGAFLYVGIPFLAPVLMFVGWEGPAQAIYTLYRPLCHQLPFRSWYLFGSQFSYTIQELQQLVGPEALVEHGYIGDPAMGFKVAFCQRDVAIYGAILVTGLLYGLVRRKVKPMPLWAYLLFGLVPIALDGGVQFVSYLLPRLTSTITMPLLESNPLRRTVTGILFGLSTVWLAYPNAQEAFDEIRETLQKRFGWK